MTLEAGVEKRASVLARQLRILPDRSPRPSLREANRVLADAGFRGVMRIHESRRIDAIPVLGTGKTDYKVLRKLVTDEMQTHD